MCAWTDVVEVELPRSVEAPAAARSAVERQLCTGHGRAALEGSVLLVSEMAACGVLYGEQPIRLRLHCEVHLVRITVTHRVTAATADLPVDEDGGLRSAVLDRLARAWGVDAADGARTLWASLPTGMPLEPRLSALPASGRTTSSA